MMTKWVENDYKLLLFREMNRNNEIKLFFLILTKQMSEFHNEFWCLNGNQIMCSLLSVKSLSQQTYDTFAQFQSIICSLTSV